MFTFFVGFKSRYGLELLATADFLIEECGSIEAAVIEERLWSERKKALFPAPHIALAIEHLRQYSRQLYPQLSLF